MIAPPMPAKRRGWENELLSTPELLSQMAAAVGENFHVVDPRTFADNLSDFAAAFEDSGVTGLIRYGFKANKSRSFAVACADAAASSATPGMFGVDVASPEEFRAALSAGVRGDEIVVTGPAHSDDVLRLATRHRALVAIDTIEQVSRVLTMAPVEHLNILLRMHPPGEATTRFGMSYTDLERAVCDLRDSDRVVLRGFSFHLSGYDIEPRVAMLHKAIEACLFSREVGHPADIVSMGGGFAVDYLDRRAWDRFRTQETGDWYFTGKPTASLYPYSSDPAGAHMLRRVLWETNAGQGVAVAERARAHGLSIMAEPGRALCDGAGISVFTVRGVHAHPDGTDVITVSGTSLSLSEQWFGSEFLPDPELVSRHNSTPSAAPPAQQHPAVVAGSTCLDSDLLSRRRIPFARKPQVGDFVIYPNTAGYQMDSNESEFHQVPVPPKLTLHRTGTTTTWSLT